MKELTCCFSGHRVFRNGDEYVLPQKLRETLLSLVQKGVKYFVCGGALGFDTLAEREILALREERPGIELHLVLPCRDQMKKWSARDKKAYEEILARADRAEFLFDSYVNGCNYVRNCEMADRSGYLVCYFTGAAGGTAQTVRYAEKHGLTIINLA